VQHTLTEHTQAIPPEHIVRIAGDIDVQVTAPFEEDHRELQPGGVFVARRGRTSDGHQYIAEAVAKGAVAVVGRPSRREAGAGGAAQ